MCYLSKSSAVEIKHSTYIIHCHILKMSGYAVSCCIHKNSYGWILSLQKISVEFYIRFLCEIKRQYPHKFSAYCIYLSLDLCKPVLSSQPYLIYSFVFLCYLNSKFSSNSRRCTSYYCYFFHDIILHPDKYLFFNTPLLFFAQPSG